MLNYGSDMLSFLSSDEREVEEEAFSQTQTQTQKDEGPLQFVLSQLAILPPKFTDLLLQIYRIIELVVAGPASDTGVRQYLSWISGLPVRRARSTKLPTPMS
jgi:hypothetical protein